MCSQISMELNIACKFDFWWVMRGICALCSPSIIVVIVQKRHLTRFFLNKPWESAPPTTDSSAKMGSSCLALEPSSMPSNSCTATVKKACTSRPNFIDHIVQPLSSSVLTPFRDEGYKNSCDMFHQSFQTGSPCTLQQYGPQRAVVKPEQLPSSCGGFIKSEKSITVVSRSQPKRKHKKTNKSNKSSKKQKLKSHFPRGQKKKSTVKKKQSKCNIPTKNKVVVTHQKQVCKASNSADELMENPKPSSAHLHSNTKTPRSAKSFNVSLAPDPTNSSYSCPTKCEPLCKSLQVTPGSKGSFSKQSPSSNTGAPRCKGAAPSDCKKPQNETSCDTDITYNPPPGTLILNDVQLPVQYPNFWLISQFGSRGTSKPARYFILRNDQHETINESHIHYFLYQTCHLCCRSVR
eukprot:GHVT01053378.1.p1 GENE.GHVT01053378.1~~GHVT01053378.1.p1  ORF type:complete len:406 (-),score=21.65 GHVT01053378.1:1578-2795(-)